MTKAMTVRELREALARPGVEDEMGVILRVTSEDGVRTDVCGLHGLTVDAGCTEVEAVVLDGDVDDDEGDDDEGDDDVVGE